jgi:hypothetical protein
VRRPSHTSERKCEYGANSSDNSDNPSAGSGSRVAVQQNWGYAPSGGLGLLVVIVIILLLLRVF